MFNQKTFLPNKIGGLLAMTDKNLVAKAGTLLTLLHHPFNERMSCGNNFLAKMIIKIRKAVLYLQRIIIKQESSMN